MKIGAYSFSHVCPIEPARNPDGSIQEFLPQARYKNAATARLNRYGAGPFCKFKVPNTFLTSGVYAVVSNDEIKYIGECQSLSPRYNMGYGIISPRNCYMGGQETNCRVNSLMLSELKQGKQMFLWFLATPDYKRVELDLLGALRPSWNRK